MGRPFAAGLMFAGVIGVSVAPVLAHHTVAATFDVSKLVSLTGTVASVDWKNPHVIYHLAAPDPNGAVIDWEIESRHLQGMRRSGVEPDTVKAGDHVTMKVMLARDGSHHAATASIILSDGRAFAVCTVTDNACPSAAPGR
jgi:uncharacterized protein DUF6152